MNRLGLRETMSLNKFQHAKPADRYKANEYWLPTSPILACNTFDKISAKMAACAKGFRILYSAPNTLRSNLRRNSVTIEVKMKWRYCQRVLIMHCKVSYSVYVI